MNIRDIALKNITAIRPYQPGKPIDELERELGIEHSIKLASNENPQGPSPAVVDALSKAVADVTRYPDGNGFALKKALAHFYQITPEQITLGNGSNDVLELAARTFVSAQDEVLFSQYAFAVYPLVTQAIGATAVIAPAKEYGHDLDAMTTLVSDKTKLIFIANPNNPTGTVLAPEAIKAFLEQIPDTVIVVLDEAYLEYADQRVNTLDWLTEHANLIITRTFSKAYGLASLRVGYSVSHPDVADMLNRIRQPFNVNSFALAAATAALADQAYIEQTKQLNDKGMRQLENGLHDLGLSTIPSKGNFIAVDVGLQADKVFQALLQQGVITRPISNYGLPRHLRVSIGLPTENARFLSALKVVLEAIA